MRITIKAIPKDGTTRIPIHYNVYIQGYIYNFLKKAYPRLHDEGFKYEKRSFRHFTFSRIFSKHMKFVGKHLEISGPISFSIAFLLEPMSNAAIKHLLMHREMRIADALFDITGADAYSDPFTGDEGEIEFDFQTLSPIVSYRTIEKDGRPYRHYFSPQEPEFYQLIDSNLRKKYATLPDQQTSETLTVFIVPIDVNPKKSRAIVKFKNTVIKGYSGMFHFRGSSKLAYMGYHTGFGSKNPQGFGMINCFNLKVK